MVMLGTVTVKAQTNDTPLPGWLNQTWQLVAPITQASNHEPVAFGGIDLNHSETVNGKVVQKKEPLGGIGDIYNFSKNFGLFMDFQFEAPSTLSGVSGSIMFQVPIYIFGGTNFYVAPNAYLGLLTHLEGAGPLNGSVDALAGAGGSIKIYKWLSAFGEYEQRQNSGEKVILAGIAAKVVAGDGTGILGLIPKHHQNRYDTKEYLSRVNGRLED